MSKVRVALFASLVLGLHAGCGGGAKKATTGTLTVQNNATQAITEVYLSPSNQATCGPNQIASVARRHAKGAARGVEVVGAGIRGAQIEHRRTT
ncbi:MAG: hypothetical protein ABR567_16225 [Myxococcales bacterium]|nr:hypothetical protein [Myxococcales bacterium]